MGGAAFAATAAFPFLFDRKEAKSQPSRSLRRDPEGLLELADGLEYTVIERAFAPMSDGYRVPAAADGMACFAGPPGTWILMRNHELDFNLHLGASPGKVPKPAYSPNAAGGVTRVVVSATDRRRVSSNLVLSGTQRNCAGGPSPWGWLSCEETTVPGHGYTFLCNVEATSLEAPRRIAGYGRYRHEAVCIDPATHVAYLTEDQGDSCLYRFVPDNKSTPFVGKLQAMRHAKIDRFDLSTQVPKRGSIPIEWVDIADPDPKYDTVRYQARDQGAARLARGEGIWFSAGTVYICSTSGGKAGLGQVFALDLGKNGQHDALRLLVESPGASTLDMPDNITVAPWGDIILAEDGAGEQYIRGLTRTGKLYDIAKNAKSAGEFAGVCFSPDGSTLFANMQMDGITVAISGGSLPKLGARS